ncbi:hypothetical protein F5876DRAFT_82697 [Lentinula aff. lateritia]|uniref:Uncharacterized protein n=1 Tax=Lentinula aff. lateritia TaxID=2804960 RepID=A0ACC1TJQ1_9AGAR|nr:hypothetical protein F5876DRAFT_82697 [Lentinula aff. lateritia]
MSNDERELELVMQRAQERMKQVKERKRAEEEARRLSKEQAARKAAKEEATEYARKQEEEAPTAADRSQQGSLLSEGSTFTWRVEVEITRVKKVDKGKGKARTEPIGGDPDNGNRDDSDNEEEHTPCEQCKNKKILCQMQAGKRCTIICKPCHDAKVCCSFSGQPSVSKQRDGGSERLAVMESQLAQRLTNVLLLREVITRTNQYLRRILRRQDEINGRLIAIETRMLMAGSTTSGPSRAVSEKQKGLKRRRVEEETDHDEEEESEEDEEEDEEPVPKKA